MKKKGVILLVIAAVLTGAIIFGTCIVAFGIGNSAENRKHAAISTVKNTVVEDSITIQQGIEAYFGVQGNWTYKKDVVRVNASGEKHSLTATFRVEESSVDVLTCSFDGDPLSASELDQLLAAMVKAAKKSSQNPSQTNGTSQKNANPTEAPTQTNQKDANPTEAPMQSDSTHTHEDKTCPKCGGLGDCSECVYGNCMECTGDGTVFCSRCGGTGKCGRCDGLGYKTSYVYGKGSEEKKCSTCNGSGNCTRCGGSGDVKCTHCSGSGNCRYCGGTDRCSNCGGDGIIN